MDDERQTWKMKVANVFMTRSPWRSPFNTYSSFFAEALFFNYLDTSLIIAKALEMVKASWFNFTLGTILYFLLFYVLNHILPCSSTKENTKLYEW